MKTKIKQTVVLGIIFTLFIATNSFGQATLANYQTMETSLKAEIKAIGIKIEQKQQSIAYLNQKLTDPNLPSSDIPNLQAHITDEQANLATLQAMLTRLQGQLTATQAKIEELSPNHSANMRQQYQQNNPAPVPNNPNDVNNPNPANSYGKPIPAGQPVPQQQYIYSIPQ
jgi:hypothetical protein